MRRREEPLVKPRADQLCYTCLKAPASVYPQIPQPRQAPSAHLESESVSKHRADTQVERNACERSWYGLARPWTHFAIRGTDTTLQKTKPGPPKAPQRVPKMQTKDNILLRIPRLLEKHIALPKRDLGSGRDGAVNAVGLDLRYPNGQQRACTIRKCCRAK